MSGSLMDRPQLTRPLLNLRSLLQERQFDNRHFAPTSPPATHSVAAPLRGAGHRL